MSHAYVNELLRISIGQVSHNIGWSNVQSSPLEILVDVYRRYITEISKTLKNYSIQYNRTEPNLDDLGLTFRDLGITLQDIKEYINNVEPVPPLYKVCSFPVKHLPNLQQPKPDCRELLVRPDHIPGYLPPMHPDLEEDVLFSQQLVDGAKKIDSNANCDSHSPLSSPKHGLKRSDWTPDTSNKKSRFYSEEEGRPMREVTSVFMTPTGFVSPVHEGKSAESSLPCLVDSPPPTPEPTHSKKDGKSKDKKEKSKSKKDKSDLSKKDLKKLKSSKKEKENKENKDKSLASSSCVTSSKKEHKSGKLDKGMKSDDLVSKPKSGKSDKMKLKVQKEAPKKLKDPFKVKVKSKMKHTSGSGSSHIKPPKLTSKKLKSAKLAKSVKHHKPEKVKVVDTLPPVLPPVVPPKEIPPEPKAVSNEPKLAEEPKEEVNDDDDLDFREESPERLVIDDSLETQQRQERESRLEVIDRCIDAVIKRGADETKGDNAHDEHEDVLNTSSRGPTLMRMRLEAKDIYDFTDTSDSSSLSSCDIDMAPPPAKKEKKEKRSSGSPKNRKKKEKKKKPRNKSPSPFSPPRIQKSSSFMLNVGDRTPSPVLRDDLLSSDGSTPSSSPRSNSFFDHSPQPIAPMLANVPPAPFGSGATFSSNPFAPTRPMPQSNFPTPPLFVTNSKSESGFQNTQPLNLAKSGSLKGSPDKYEAKENSDLLKKAANILDKSKAKDHKKDKNKKKGKKELDKMKEEPKEKEKPKPKEKPKAKPEKVPKSDKKKKPEKKKGKEDKSKEDTTVPKMTLKLSNEAGSTKIFVKPNSKHSTPLSSSPSPNVEDDLDEDLALSPAPPSPHLPLPSPPRAPTPPLKDEPMLSPPIKTPSRGRGRGRKSAATAAIVPPARTVITETVGTIIDESGNKIWICPACSRADDGSPMIGCDECDDWYHWVCVGIVVPPKEEEQWFCVRCISKRQGPAAKKRRKKNRKEK